MIEIKAIQGDSSDCIPGVAGIGPKGAGQLIQAYHNIDYIYEHLDRLEIRDTLRKRLADGKDSAYLSRRLGTIRTDAPIDTDLARLRSRKARRGGRRAADGKAGIFQAD